jgi:outer membrane immunogenic protein
MNKLAYSSAAAALLLACAGAASAQTATWSGPYIAGHIGVSATRDNNDESIKFDPNLDGKFANEVVLTSGGLNAFGPGFCGGAAGSNVPTGGCSENDDGQDIGVRAGYDWQFGNVVVGALGEVASQDLEDSVSAFSTTPASYTMTRELNWTGSIRGRVGYAFDRFLPYATAGAVYADMDNSFTTTNGVNTFTSRGDKDGVWGWQAGVGGEMKLTEKVSVGVEYLYSSFQDDGYKVRASGPAPATNPFILINPNGTDFRRSDDEFNTHAVRMTASYRF